MKNDGRHQEAPSAVGHPEVPTVRTTRPEEDNVERLPAYPAPSQSNAVERASEIAVIHRHGTANSELSLPNTQARTPHQLRREPRKFHFTRTTTSIRNPSVLHSGIQKTRKKQNHNLATFVERTDSFEKSRYHGRNPPNLGEKRPELGSDPLRPSVDLLGSRKRPLASTAERKWREQTWKQPPQSNAREEPAVERTEGRDAGTDSLHLASQLQQFALDVSRAEDEAHGAHAKTHAKVKPKPKPPKPRPSKAETEATEGTQYDHGDAMDLSEIQGDNPENFVFDVYVRQTEHLHEEPLTGMQNTALNSADPDKVGVLVIADEDQETWELYGAEDQSSDEDWNSEEENENGQHHPFDCGHCGHLAD